MSSTKAAYARNLDQLAALLKSEPLTAKEIAKRLGCSHPTVYARIEALKARGDRVFTSEVQTGSTGPRPLTYSVR